VANLADTAAALRGALLRNQALSARSAAAIQRFDADLALLASQVQNLHAIYRVVGDYPVALRNVTYTARYFTTFPSVWDGLKGNLLGALEAIPELVVGLKAIVKAAGDLAKSALCALLPGVFCNGAMLTLIVVVVFVIVALCVLGPPLAAFMQQRRAAQALGVQKRMLAAMEAR
jgi:hypothetical protein